MEGLTNFNREMIQIIFQRNEDAVDLLVKLLQIDWEYSNPYDNIKLLVFINFFQTYLPEN